MKRIILFLLFACFSIVQYGQIIANHTIVDQYDKIPQQYIAEVKKMWVAIVGESHSAAYRQGLVLLESLNPTFAANVTEGRSSGGSYD